LHYADPRIIVKRFFKTINETDLDIWQHHQEFVLDVAPSHKSKRVRQLEQFNFSEAESDAK
jgi:hypothetical protein